jgi:DNA topoisomerase-2
MTETFKVLDDRQHCLLRPQMYIGSVTPEPHSGIINYQYQTKTIVPGLIKIIEEILQNSVDEYIRTNGEFANKIEVSIDNTVQGTEIAISDNGRGIPVKLIGDTYQPVLAWTKLKAGSNFDDSNRVGAGMNGVGSSLTNIFSTSFIGTSCDGSKKIVVTCSDNMANVDFKVSKSSHRGTEVKFVPDLEKFNLTEFTQDHLDVIRDRITNLAIMFEGITFVFNGEKIKFRNIKQIAKHFHESAISIQDDNVALVFAPSGDDEEFRCLSYVNSIYVKNGGSHIDYVLNRIIEDVRAFVKKKHKIDVLPNQIRQHLLFASWIRNFPSPKFDSQAKERITNSTGEISGVLGNLDYEKIAKQILNTPEIIDPMIAAILYKKELADRAALAKKQKGAAKVRVVNHIAATDPNPENRMILLAEGLSAIGALIKVRNPKTTGGYPLRGKPLNVRGMKPLDIVKNKEMFELMSILGLEIGKPAENLNYGKIAIFADSDVDGSHIVGLLLNFFSLWPELFEQKRIYRMVAPLYFCTKGKDTKIFYSTNEFNKANLKGYNVDYFKGLGSMPEEVYAQCVNNPYLIQIAADDMNKLEMAFGDKAELRKDWLLSV